MKINKEDVRHVAQLSRLDIDEASLESFAGQIDSILQYIDTLNAVNTEGVPQTSHAVSINNAFREDTVVDETDREVLLSNAPEAEDGCFVVPKVVG